MDLQFLVENARVFLLVLARVFAMIQTSPLFSSSSTPRIAKIGLSFFASVAVFPVVAALGYPIPDSGLGFAALLIGEALVGVVMGFFLNLIYSSFLLAGQFFSLQMGFGASQVFDPLAQIQIPLMGQFLNTIGMFVFISVGGFQKVFLQGLLKSFQSVKAVDFASQREYIFGMVMRGMGGLFENSLIISLPVLGTLFLVSLTMGLLAKAAPQMNLLMMGFPVAIFVAFTILMFTMPFIMETFGAIINDGFNTILILLDRVQEGAR